MSTTIPITRADGFLVTYADGGLRSWDLRDSLEEAHGAYSYPPKGWQSIGISACKDGVPFASLDVPTIQIVTPMAVAAE